MPNHTKDPASTTRDAIFVSVKEASRLLGLSRSKFYELLDRDLIESRRLEGRRLVVLSSLQEFADSLPRDREAS